LQDDFGGEEEAGEGYEEAEVADGIGQEKEAGVETAATVGGASAWLEELGGTMWGTRPPGAGDIVVRQLRQG
jgi:hypothetical protein